MTLKLSTTIPLAMPLGITVDQRTQTVDQLTLRRPKTRHVKALVALVGADLVSALLADTGGDVEKARNVDLRKLMEPVLPRLMGREALGLLSELLSDLLGIKPEEFDELDPLDTLKVFKGFADFFPALQSIA